MSPQDRFLGILPFFHSFGFTATLTAPAVIGIGVAFHPNPLDAKPIGELVRRYPLTYLMATPTFLQLYLRSCDPADFGSLRFAMVSAEKLPDWLANAFEDKFGLRPGGRLRLHGVLAGGDVRYARCSRRRRSADGQPPGQHWAAATRGERADRIARHRRSHCRWANRACCWCAART